MVSIVVTCFDTDPDMLSAAVDSACAQTYEPVEVIVVDDGSTATRTLDRLAQLGGRVDVLQQANRGVSAARNHGMSAARGELLLPLDSDDLIDPGFLEATVPVLHRDSTLAVVSTQAAYFGDREGPMRLSDPTLPWMVAENSIHNTSLFRREDFDRLGGYDESLRLGFEDHEWWVRLLLNAGTATILDDVLFRYRIRPGSRNASAASSERALTELRAAMLRNNPQHVRDLAAMGMQTLDVALHRMHHAEARVAHLEHHLGPVVRIFDRSPRLRSSIERLRRLKSRAG